MANGNDISRLSPAAAAGLAAVAGFLAWAIFSLLGPTREAWDSGGWWLMGLPVLAVLSGILGYLVPVRVWRWPASIYAGQLVAMLVVRPAGSGFGLFPLMVIFVLIPLAIAFTVPALIGGAVRRDGWDIELMWWRKPPASLD